MVIIRGDQVLAPNHIRNFRCQLRITQTYVHVVEVQVVTLCINDGALIAPGGRTDPSCYPLYQRWCTHCAWRITKLLPYVSTLVHSLHLKDYQVVTLCINDGALIASGDFVPSLKTTSPLTTKYPCGQEIYYTNNVSFCQ